MAGVLLFLGYITSFLIDDKSANFPDQLVGILLSTLILAVLFSKAKINVPTISENAILVIRTIALLCLTAELVYFGIPLLGSIPYNEFGWPVIHHFAVTGWVLVLFGNKNKNFDLTLTLSIAILLFNRQLALYAILSYLLTSQISKRRLVIGGLSLSILILFLGILRNFTLEVNASIVTNSVELENSPFFFIYLYLIGPLYSSLDLSSGLWDNYLVNFWNTLPGWMILNNLANLSPALSYALFYSLTTLVVYILLKTKFLQIRILGSLIHVYLFFSFFSNVLISTPIIANYLIILMAITFFPKSRNERSNFFK